MFQRHQKEQIGIISRIENHGTIILVLLRSSEGWLTPVFFEHTPFRWLLDSEQCSPDQLIGRQAKYDGKRLELCDGTE